MGGKTWTAYTLAGIFGPQGYLEYMKDLMLGDLDSYETLDAAAEQVIKTGAATIDLVQFVNNYGEVYFNNIAHYSQHWIADFLRTELISFKNFDVSVKLLETKEKIAEKILRNRVTRFIGGTEEETSMTIRKASRDKNLYVYVTKQTPSDGGKAQELPPEIIKEFIKSTILQMIHQAVYPHIRVFPTERTTFIAFISDYRPPVSGEKAPLDENLVALTKKSSLASGAVTHFLSMMRNVGTPPDLKRREVEASTNAQIHKYMELARKLEKEILGGNLNYSSDGIFFQPSKDNQLEISIVSSMVKELSPLLFYLRYLAKPNELIVIDEPEMNLHPEAQVKIIEFLAMLVNANINILITTHSPYITDHLTNLIKADASPDKKNISRGFYLKNADAFLSKEKVSVYLFNKGKVSNAMDKNGLINLDTFGNVSDRISDIYFTL